MQHPPNIFDVFYTGTNSLFFGFIQWLFRLILTIGGYGPLLVLIVLFF